MLLEVFGSEGPLDQMGSIHPIGRIGRPEEIADAVANSRMIVVLSSS
jgi:hypothetical protein